MLQLMLHAFIHQQRAAGKDIHVPLKPGMIPQAEGSAVTHLHIHGGVSIMPVQRVEEPVGRMPVRGPHAVHRVGPFQQHRSGLHDESAPVLPVGAGKAGKNGIKHELLIASVIHHAQNGAAVFPGVPERTLPGSTLLECQRGSSPPPEVGNHAALIQAMEGKRVRPFRHGAEPHLHAVSVEIQGSPAIAERKIPPDLPHIIDDDAGPVVGQHIVGGIPSLALQISGAGTAQVQANIIIPLPFNEQVAFIRLPPFTGVIRGVRKLHMHIHPRVHNISGGIQHVAFPFRGSQEEVGGSAPFRPAEARIAYPLIHISVQHNTLDFIS